MSAISVWSKSQQRRHVRALFADKRLVERISKKNKILEKVFVRTSTFPRNWDILIHFAIIVENRAILQSYVTNVSIQFVQNVTFIIIKQNVMKQNANFFLIFSIQVTAEPVDSLSKKLGVAAWIVKWYFALNALMRKKETQYFDFINYFHIFM